VIGNSEGIFWHMKCISPTTIIIPDILHTIFLGVIQHLMDWVTSFLKQHSRIARFNQLWRMILPYPGSPRFNKPYTQVMVWSGEEKKTLLSVIVPVFAATPLNPSASKTIPFIDDLLCVKNFVYFNLMAQFQYHTEGKMEYMEIYPKEFLHHRDVSSQYGASISTQKLSEALKNQPTMDKHDQRMSDPMSNDDSAAAKSPRIEDDKTGIEAHIEKHPVDESDFDLVQMHLLNTSLTISASLVTPSMVALNC